MGGLQPQRDDGCVGEILAINDREQQQAELVGGDQQAEQRKDVKQQQQQPAPPPLSDGSLTGGPGGGIVPEFSPTYGVNLRLYVSDSSSIFCHNSAMRGTPGTFASCMPTLTGKTTSPPNRRRNLDQGAVLDRSGALRKGRPRTTPPSATREELYATDGQYAYDGCDGRPVPP